MRNVHHEFVAGAAAVLGKLEDWPATHTVAARGVDLQLEAARQCLLGPSHDTHGKNSLEPLV